MLISLVVLRLEIADHCHYPNEFQSYSAPDFQLPEKREQNNSKLTYAAVVGSRVTFETEKSKQEDYLPDTLSEHQGQRYLHEITLETIYATDSTKENNRDEMKMEEKGTNTKENGREESVTKKDSSIVRKRALVEAAVPSTSREGSEESSQSLGENDHQFRPLPSRECPGLEHESQSSLPRLGSGSSYTRPKSHSPTLKVPTSIHFFFGNPCVELTKGILHIYKDSERTSLDQGVARSEMICMLAVPASYNIHDLLTFTAPMNADSCIEYMRIIRDATPNQYMVLLKFRDQTAADEFYSYFNNRPYNSIEPDICHLVYVARLEIVKESEGATLPIPGLTELPNCPVCLERMDESVDGILTVLCNHAFHTTCLAKWGDTSCPVCRYCQTPEEVADNHCMKCGSHESLWICLICGHVGCGRYVGMHAYSHFQDTNHTYAMQLGNNRVWDYAADNYVHRLVQNKSDGKLVEVDEGGNVLVEEKLDSLTQEYTYLLTTQLESQRLYFEEQMAVTSKEAEERVIEAKDRWKNVCKERDIFERQLSEVTREKHSLDKKCSHFHSRLSKVLAELQEEKEMNKCLRENQQLWQKRVTTLEDNLKEVSQTKDGEIQELKDQVRDIMFYLEAQQKLATSTEVSQEEIQEGRVIVGESASASSPTGKKSRKKPR